MTASAAAESVARDCYGRLLAYLTCRTWDLSAAEDALSDAFLAALETWPDAGVPRSPEAWLLSVARRKLIDMYRRSDRFDSLDEGAAAREQAALHTEARLPDERLRLMLVCAHPAIDASIRPALMLQTVLGLDARSIASAFLLAPDTMAKRLTRAKRKIREAGIGFEPPAPAELSNRLHAVLEAIYAAYFLGREGTLTEGDARDELRGEAWSLARVVADLAADKAETLGLLALLSFCEARRPAQVDENGDFVPLLKQDTTRWNRVPMREGYKLLEKSSALRQPGPFQIEAAIQAAHCYRAHCGTTPWTEIAVLYDRLTEQHPTIGAMVGRAIAHAHAKGQAADGIRLLDDIDPGQIRDYQPWWVARGYLLEMLDQPEAANGCLARGLGLTSQPRVQRFLIAQMSKNQQSTGSTGTSG